MDESRSKQLWDHTSEVVAIIANRLRGSDTPAVTARQIHPHYRSQHEEKIQVLSPKKSVELLEKIFGGRNG